MKLLTIEVFFDGGGSHDFAYGSWQVCFMGFSKRVSRFKVEPLDPCLILESPLRATSNIAEYVSLIRALEWIQSVKEKGFYNVVIRGDSMLVINQIRRKWKCRMPHLKPFKDRCRELLQDFGDWHAEWYSRENNVARFGH